MRAKREEAEAQAKAQAEAAEKAQEAKAKAKVEAETIARRELDRKRLEEDLEKGKQRSMEEVASESEEKPSGKEKKGKR